MGGLCPSQLIWVGAPKADGSWYPFRSVTTVTRATWLWTYAWILEPLWGLDLDFPFNPLQNVDVRVEGLRHSTGKKW